MLYCSSGVEHVFLKVCAYMCLHCSVSGADHCMIRWPPYSMCKLTLCWTLASFLSIEVLYTTSILLNVCQWGKNTQSVQLDMLWLPGRVIKASSFSLGSNDKGIFTALFGTRSENCIIRWRWETRDTLVPLKNRMLQQKQKACPQFHASRII